jgi:UPF0716 protein FxsA
VRVALLLFLVFTLVPAAETWLVIQVGQRIGATETVLSLIAAGLLGAWLGKRAGSTVLRELFEGLRRGEPPADKIVEGVLALVGATLLITPGYLTDLVGLLLLVGPVRRWLAPRVKSGLWRWLSARGFRFVGEGAPGPAARARASAEQSFVHPVAE